MLFAIKATRVFRRNLIITFLSIVCSVQLYAHEDIIVTGPESKNDKRVEYNILLFKAALESTIDEQEDYNLIIAPSMNRKRKERSLKGGKVLHVMTGAPRTRYKDMFTPVLIPLRKGLMGYKVFLIHQKNRHILSNINSISDLKQLTIGQSKNWSSADILENAGFQVVKGSSYEGLFGMLDKERFTLFARGAGEVQYEIDLFGKIYPDLMIEESVILYYQQPDYFWFNNDAAGEKLAKRIDGGLRRLVKSGEFDKLFNQYHGAFLKQLALKDRKVFRIENPTLLPEHIPPAELLYKLGDE